MSENPLGKSTPSPDRYAPELLYPIPRWASRSLLDIDKNVLMYGIDHWHAYEVSWLDLGGKPQVAVGEFLFDADSVNIIESKSLKLYLNSINEERYQNRQTVESLIEADLSRVSESEVKVALHDIDDEQLIMGRGGLSIDSCQPDIGHSQPNPELLVTVDEMVDDEQLHSDLFRSNCPVTGQPDWASVELRYTGPKLDQAGLLSYICSYRSHQAYHEECAERMFRDLVLQCQPRELRLGLNFLRRGGLDINVYRSSVPVASDSVSDRLHRQ